MNLNQNTLLFLPLKPLSYKSPYIIETFEESVFFHSICFDVRLTVDVTMSCDYRNRVSGEVIEASCLGQSHKVFFREKSLGMAEGTIKKVTQKGFGFIDTGTGKDLFFHMSDLEGVTFEELYEGQRVSFNEGSGPKGPKAENVKPA